jgi:hypothetical protein
MHVLQVFRVIFLKYTCKSPYTFRPPDIGRSARRLFERVFSRNWVQPCLRLSEGFLIDGKLNKLVKRKIASHALDYPYQLRFMCSFSIVLLAFGRALSVVELAVDNSYRFPKVYGSTFRAFRVHAQQTGFNGIHVSLRRSFLDFHMMALGLQPIANTSQILLSDSIEYNDFSRSEEIRSKIRGNIT